MSNTAQQKDPWKDRRLYGRSHVLWGARLLSAVGEQDCVILDLSAAGAMVRLSDASVSPAHVAVSADHFGKLRGRVMWQQGNVVRVFRSTAGFTTNYDSPNFASSSRRKPLTGGRRR
jgi:transposase